jgi:hypothetical protein
MLFLKTALQKENKFDSLTSETISDLPFPYLYYLFWFYYGTIQVISSKTEESRPILPMLVTQILLCHSGEIGKSPSKLESTYLLI